MDPVLWRLFDKYEDFEVAELSDMFKREAVTHAELGNQVLSDKYHSWAVAAMVCVASRQCPNEPYGIDS